MEQDSIVLDAVPIESKQDSPCPRKVFSFFDFIWVYEYVRSVCVKIYLENTE